MVRIAGHLVCHANSAGKVLIQAAMPAISYQLSKRQSLNLIFLVSHLQIRHFNVGSNLYRKALYLWWLTKINIQAFLQYTRASFLILTLIQTILFHMLILQLTTSGRGNDPTSNRVCKILRATSWNRLGRTADYSLLTKKAVAIMPNRHKCHRHSNTDYMKTHQKSAS